MDDSKTTRSEDAVTKTVDGAEAFERARAQGLVPFSEFAKVPDWNSLFPGDQIDFSGAGRMRRSRG